MTYLYGVDLNPEVEPVRSSQNNLILHEHLYPNATRKAQRLNRRTSGGGGGGGGGRGGNAADREHRKGSFDFLRCARFAVKGLNSIGY